MSWKKGKSGNPKGRPKSISSIVEAELVNSLEIKISRSQCLDVVRALLDMSVEELEKIASSKKLPSFIVVVASAVLGDIAARKMVTVNFIFKRR